LEPTQAALSISLYTKLVRQRIVLSLASLVLLLGLVLIPQPVHAAARFVFPVLGSSSFSNDYDADRSNGKHRAIDIIANKHQPVVSATDGTIVYVPYPQPDWGYAVVVRSTDNQCLWYIHLNNDNRGTDDGKGGGMKAYAPDVAAGNPVKKGQLLGWVGDSGNAESTVSHLHFSVHNLTESSCTSGGEHGNTPVNPYNALRNASRISKPVDYPQLPNELLPFNTWYKYKLNIARGNLTGDIQDELVVGTGFGQTPKIRVFDSAKQQIDGFYASDTAATYGVDVAVGDIDGDEVNEIIAGYRTEEAPMVAVFKKTQDTPSLVYEKVAEFTAFEGNTSPRVTTGDVDGDGNDEIIAAKGRGSSPAVRIFDETGLALSTAFVLPMDFRGGLDVASGDVAEDEKDEIVVSILTDGSSFIRVFDADFNKVSGPGFYSYEWSQRNGVYVSVGDVIPWGNMKEEILTLPNGGNPNVRHFDSTGTMLRSQYFMEQWWEGYYDIAAGTNSYSAATGGNRRGSIR
jgi:hypothetical protein